MASLVLETHGGGYLLRTAKKFACGYDRTDKEWEPARPLSILYQFDAEFPGLASLIGGWTPCSECRNTDGTIDCEHHTAHEMIESASTFLNQHTGVLSGKKYINAYETVEELGDWG